MQKQKVEKVHEWQKLNYFEKQSQVLRKVSVEQSLSLTQLDTISFSLLYLLENSHFDHWIMQIHELVEAETFVE